MINATGNNIRGLFAIDGVDKSRTTTNNIYVIYRLYGVEAARKKIISEFIRVFTTAEEWVDNSHLASFVDMMCITGKPCGVRPAASR